MTLMLRGMVIDTPTNGSVITSLVCVKCPINFENMDFELDLVCLPLAHMDVILVWIGCCLLELTFIL